MIGEVLDGCWRQMSNYLISYKAFRLSLQFLSPVQTRPGLCRHIQVTISFLIPAAWNLTIFLRMSYCIHGGGNWRWEKVNAVTEGE
jgi:hypothetical protein